MEEKRLTRTERTDWRQHLKCVDPRFEHNFKVMNNKHYSKYCTWFSLYSWFDCIIKNKNNNVSEDVLNFISNYKSPSDFANNYLFKNENGEYEYYNLKENKNEKINFEFNQEYYNLKTIRELLKVAHQTLDNYLKYLNIEQNCIDGVKVINIEDVKKLISWCNEYSKNERASLISKKTNLEKYGVEHALQSKEIQNKAKETCKEHYGVEHPAQSEEIQKLFVQTNLMTYGVENPSQSQIIKDKKAQTTMEHYGVENPFQAEEIIEKINTDKHPTRNRYFYKGVAFDSATELYFYIYHHDILKDDITRGKMFVYYVNGKKARYFCDFLLNGENVEIKGRHLIDTKTMILHTYLDEIPLLEKTQCLKDNNVRIIIDNDKEMIRISKLVEKQFPHLVESCRIKKSEIEDENYEDEYDDYDTTNTIFEM